MSNPMSTAVPSGARAFSAVRGPYVGKRVGPYTVCLELASGGMASVFLARAESGAERAQLVALKVIHPHLAQSSDFVEMFVDEAQLSSRLRHRNVCQVFEFDKVDDTYYLAMEYLMGEPMSAIFRRTARRTVDCSKHAALVVRIVADACAGLHAAHGLRGANGAKLNVVHRDVSPENLFVTYAGVTKVVDFGLACAKHQRHRTRTGVIKGKFAYLSPEALDGARVDQRADIWGLGVVLWEALTGRRLFRGDSDTQTLAAVVEAPILPPSAVRPGLPKALDRPVLRALSRKPAERQRSAAQLAKELFEACPAAAAASEGQIAEWMTSLFGDQQRWKSQIVELVQALSHPDNALEAALDSAPTRVRAASSLQTAVPPPTARRRHLLAGAALLCSLLGAASLIELPLIEGDAREPQPRVSVAPATATAEARPAQAEAPRVVEVPSELNAQQLVEGTGYLLEIVEPTPGKKAFRLRIQPDPQQPSDVTPSAEPMDGAKPSRAPQATEGDAPPIWLREYMEPRLGMDLREGLSPSMCRVATVPR